MRGWRCRFFSHFYCASTSPLKTTQKPHQKIQVDFAQKIVQLRDAAELEKGRVGGDEDPSLVLRKKPYNSEAGEGHFCARQQGLQFLSGGFVLLFQVSLKYKK
ncbi:hypothetical protein EBU02_00395 [bacterium]|nr:hypothetical protein [bacterium]NBS51614.1 hypothetical protein [Spartobacteria bacterium]